MVAQVGPLAVAGLVFVAGAFLPESDYGRTSTLIGLVQWLLQVPLGVLLLYSAAATIYFDMADAISLRVVAPAPVVSLVSSLARGHRGGSPGA
jgi:hypothetical protein